MMPLVQELFVPFHSHKFIPVFSEIRVVHFIHMSSRFEQFRVMTYAMIHMSSRFEQFRVMTYAMISA